MEKFLDIKCRQAGLKPELAVVVATVRALKLHGGGDGKALDKEDLGAVERGLPNLLRHVENLAKFGLPVLVGINRFLSDTPAELKLIEEKCAAAGAKAYLCEHWAKGGAGAESLARAVVATLDEGKAAFKPLYPDDMPLAQKIETVAKEIYRASGIAIAGPAQRRLKALEAAGYGKLPVCIAKTQYSFCRRSRTARRAHRAHAADPRGSSVGRGGVRGRHGGRHHEHARPAARSGGGAHPPDRQRRGRRHLLITQEVIAFAAAPRQVWCMNNLNAFVEKYISIWNESDDAARRRHVRELWVEDARHLAKTLDAVGHDGIENRVATAYEKWVREKGCVFRLRDGVDGHHGTIKLRWEMLPTAGGEVISVGFDFLVLAADGRIRTGYQFIEA